MYGSKGRMSGPTRPWGSEPPEPPPEWYNWLLDREKARAKEARWKEFADKKKGVEHEIIKFHGASHRLDEAMTRKFWDGVADHEIPERLVALWGEYDRYVQHSGPEYEKVRAAALACLSRSPWQFAGTCSSVLDRDKSWKQHC